MSRHLNNMKEESGWDREGCGDSGGLLLRGLKSGQTRKTGWATCHQTSASTHGLTRGEMTLGEEGVTIASLSPDVKSEVYTGWELGKVYLRPERKTNLTETLKHIPVFLAWQPCYHGDTPCTPYQVLQWALPPFSVEKLGGNRPGAVQPLGS